MLRAVRVTVLLALLLGLPARSGAVVAFGAVSAGHCNQSTGCTGGAPATTLTFAHTTGAGSERGLAVGVCVSGPGATVMATVVSVTYAGVSLVQKKHQGTNYYCDLWSLPDGTQPTTGTNNVVVVIGATGLVSNSVINAQAISVTGVDQTTAWTATDGGNAGTGTTATATISASGANDLGVHFECNGTSISTTVGTNETSRVVGTTNTNGACNTMGAATATGGDTAFSRTVGSDSWVMVGGAFKASGAAPARQRFTVY